MTEDPKCEVGSSACDPTEEKLDQIRRRSYELCEAIGQEDDHDVEDWLQAEAEIIGGKPLVADLSVRN